MSISENFCERVKRVREDLGLNQEELAKALGYSRNYISMVEGGREPGPKFSEQWLSFEKARGIKSEQPKATLLTGPRGDLARALHARGWTAANLAKKIGYAAGPVQAVVDGGARISEAMAQRIEREIPELTVEHLLGGSEMPRVLDESGLIGTVGTLPKLEYSEGTVRMLPKISWTQAGARVSFDDEIYSHEAVPAINVTDPKAFVLDVRGDSMEPRIKEGDSVVVCPSWTPRNGDIVIARTDDGDVMCKIYQAKKGGEIILSSYNTAHPPVELRRSDVAWIYPISQVMQTIRTER